MLHEEARREVAAACQRLKHDGLVVGTAGNVSVRVGEHVVISPSGVDYEVLRAEHVGVHRLGGEPVEAPLKPSSEMPLHLAVYARTPAEAIVHNHAPASTALSTIVDEVPTSHYYTAMFGGPIRVAPYATFGTEALAEHVAAALDGRLGALMGNHGALTIGRDLKGTYDRLAYLEYVCDVQLRAMTTALPVRTLPAEEIEHVATLLGSYGQSLPEDDAGS